MADNESDLGDAGIEPVLEHLKEARAFDFTGYKRATLTRRILKRMEQVGVADPTAYVDYLEVHPDEFEPLFNTILINVTSFFRDADAWDVLRERVVPELIERRPDQEIRVWSAGCSTGQEAYSAVMTFAEAMGIEAARDRLKVYATDVDEEALDHARAATYHGRELESLPEDLRDKYFDGAEGSGKTFTADLRRTVIFGRHDLLQDAPISRVDLLLCRNTLMYFNSEAQSHLVNRLHYALADDGFLLLGKVEMLLGRGRPVRAGRRQASPVPKVDISELARTIVGDGRVHEPARGSRALQRRARCRRLRTRSRRPTRARRRRTAGCHQRPGPDAVRDPGGVDRPSVPGLGDLVPARRAAVRHRPSPGRGPHDHDGRREPLDARR